MQNLQDLDGEIWKDIKDFQQLYQVSNMGRVKSLSRIVNFKNGGNRKYDEKLMTPGEHKKGYQFLRLTKDKQTFYRSVHRLVAFAFIPNPENKPQVNHIDGNVRNNRYDNLNWMTNSDTQLYKQAGNTISVKVIKAILKNLLKYEKDL